MVSAVVTNSKTTKFETLHFYVLPGHRQAILGAAACQYMELLSVRTDNILSADASDSASQCYSEHIAAVSDVSVYKNDLWRAKAWIY